MGEVPEPETVAGWVPEDENVPLEEDFAMTLGATEQGSEVRLYQVMSEDVDGTLVAFAIKLEVHAVDGTWKEVARVDTSHGTLHVHQFAGAEQINRTELRTIETVYDVESAYHEGYSYLLERWQPFVRRWSR